MEIFYEKYDNLFKKVKKTKLFNPLNFLKHEERKKRKLVKFDLHAQEEKKLLDCKLSQVSQQIKYNPLYSIQI